MPYHQKIHALWNDSENMFLAFLVPGISEVYRTPHFSNEVASIDLNIDLTNYGKVNFNYLPDEFFIDFAASSYAS